MSANITPSSEWSSHRRRPSKMGLNLNLASPIVSSNMNHARTRSRALSLSKSSQMDSISPRSTYNHRHQLSLSPPYDCSVLTPPSLQSRSSSNCTALSSSTIDTVPTSPETNETSETSILNTTEHDVRLLAIKEMRILDLKNQISELTNQLRIEENEMAFLRQKAEKSLYLSLRNEVTKVRVEIQEKKQVQTQVEVQEWVHDNQPKLHLDLKPQLELQSNFNENQNPSSFLTPVSTSTSTSASTPSIHLNTPEESRKSNVTIDQQIESNPIPIPKSSSSSSSSTEKRSSFWGSAFKIITDFDAKITSEIEKITVPQPQTQTPSKTRSVTPIIELDEKINTDSILPLSISSKSQLQQINDYYPRNNLDRRVFDMV